MKSIGLPPIDPEYRVQFLKLPDTMGRQMTHWQSNPGPQTWSLLCGIEEILVGGRRGGGKSDFLIAKSAMGDMALPEDDPARLSFLNDKDYRGLLLREEYQSMAEFIEKAVDFYRPFRGKAAGNPVHIDFESGARIYFNHLNDPEAFNKYKGWNLTFIGIEELTMIRTAKLYLKLLGSLRSVDRIRNGKKFPPLRTQIVSTTNPDGPGAGWVKDRFVEVYRADGTMIPNNRPMIDKITGGIRIFIPFPIDANPFLAENTVAGKRYRINLLSQDEVTRKQWMDGDWNAGSSKYFSEYRPDGPIGDDEKAKYPHARHLIKPVELKPWWFRWGSGDHGYDHPAAFHKFCRNEKDSRIHVYDELQVRRVGSFELGALMAKWWQSDLLALAAAGQSPCITIHLGSDAFSKTDISKTKAEQIESGIKEVFGPYGALLLKYNEDEREAMMRDPKRAAMMFESRKKKMGSGPCIALKPVYMDRIAAWGYMRDMVRFRPAVLDLQTPDDRDHYLRQVLAEEGREEYERQSAAMHGIKPEILPKLQIWDNCRELNRCMKVAQRDTSADGDPSRESKSEDVLKFNADSEGEGGDDALESGRNGIFAYQEIQTTMPKSYYVNDRMSEVQADHIKAFGEELTDPTRLMMIANTQAARYDSQNAASGAMRINFPRAGSMRHRGVQ